MTRAILATSALMAAALGALAALAVDALLHDLEDSVETYGDWEVGL
jgi:predicted HD phosphohydrolase